MMSNGYMLTSLILGIWLILRIDKGKQAFLEASLFTFLSMLIVYLMLFTIPAVDNIWLVSWFALWVFALAAFWLLDVVSINFVGGAVFSVLAGIGYFFLQQHIQGWIKLLLDGKFSYF